MENTQKADPPYGVEVDVGSLAAFDTRVGEEGSLIERTRSGIEPLIHALFMLPSEQTDDGRLAEMPKPSTRTPREKPIPKEREPTKWEKFAKEKGIVKKRRDRLVWDETSGEYMPRYGRNSVKSLQRDVVLPHKESLAEGDDPFSAKRREKKERIKGEKKKQLINLGRAEKNKNKVAPLQSLHSAPRGPSGKRRIPMQSLKDGISVLQKSTASAGKFDKRVRNEPKIMSKGKRRKFDPVAGKKGLDSEKERAQKVLNRVLLGNQ